MRGDEFLDKMELINHDLIEAADAPPMKRNHWIKWGAIAACLCLILGGTTVFMNNQQNSKAPVLTWDSAFQPSDYFRYNDKNSGINTSSSIDSSAIEFSAERYFSDYRKNMENSQIIPALPDHPLFNCIAKYNNDNSIYSVTFSWHQQGDTYSNLSIVAGTQEVKQIQDCIAVEIDEDGNIVPPAVTVTERDGIKIVAEGSKNSYKTITFQNSTGWYQISGSGYDSYESMTKLLDWLWEHPINFENFAIEKGSEITSSTINEHPEVFSNVLPHFEDYGYLLGENHLLFKDGKPLDYEGHYYNGITQDLIDSGEYLFQDGWTEIHWCITTEPDYYDLQASLGELSSLSEQQVKDLLNTDGKISFMLNGYMIKIYSRDSDIVWNMLVSLMS